MNANYHIWIGRRIVAMVTALDHVLSKKIHFQEIALHESGSRVNVYQFK